MDLETKVKQLEIELFDLKNFIKDLSKMIDDDYQTSVTAANDEFIRNVGAGISNRIKFSDLELNGKYYSIGSFFKVKDTKIILEYIGKHRQHSYEEIDYRFKIVNMDNKYQYLFNLFSTVTMREVLTKCKKETIKPIDKTVCEILYEK